MGPWLGPLVVVSRSTGAIGVIWTLGIDWVVSFFISLPRRTVTSPENESGQVIVKSMDGVKFSGMTF